MSSPPIAPTPSSQNLAKTQSQRSYTQTRPATGTNPSTPAPAGTPAQHATPASNAPFLSPSLNRVGNTAGKTTLGSKTSANKGLAGKTLNSQHATPAGAQNSSSPAAANMMATPSLGGSTGVVGSTTFDSPSHAALAAAAMEPASSSNPMGLGLSSLGFNNLGIHGAGGNLSHLGMMSGLSGGMLGTSSMGVNAGPGRLDEAERRRRLESVLSTLGERTGRICQEGLERLARRMGLEMFDEYKDGERSLTLAGQKMFAVDVVFRPPSSSVVHQTSFSFHDVNEDTITDFSPAAAILREDLSPPAGTSAINAKLDSFARNLEKLSNLERLSVDTANCFEAISGIYRSLKKLYEHEKKLAETVAESRSGSGADAEVACKKSGRPRMNVRRTVGLSIEYWRDHHLMTQPEPTTIEPRITMSDGDEAMPDSSEPAESEPEEDVELYSLKVDIQSYASSMYPPIRTSSSWIGDAIVKPQNTSGETNDNQANTAPPEIDWLDPSPATLTDPKLSPPEARFTAQLSPSLTVPIHVFGQVLSVVCADVDISQEQLQQSTYDSLLLAQFPQIPRRKHHTDPITSTASIPTFGADEAEEEQNWETRLYFPRQDFARTLHEVPFSHPRQLVTLLPVLRQYTLLVKLIRSALGPQPPNAISSPKSTLDVLNTNDADSVPLSRVTSLEQANAQTAQDELDALLASTPAPSVIADVQETDEDTVMPDAIRAAPDGKPPPRIFDLSVSLSPTPRLSLILATALGLLTNHIAVNLNGELAVTCFNEAVEKLLEDVKSEDRVEKRRKIEAGMAKGLALTEDLPMWAEWLQKKFVS